MADGDLDSVAVVVPARDEEQVLPACLAAVGRARSTIGPLGVRVRTIVVADSCRDATVTVTRDAGAHVLRTEAGAVGAARSAGCALALRLLGGAPSRRQWLACTDADTVVPADWLVSQLAAARAGYDAVAGLIDLDAAGDAAASARWRAWYRTDCRRSWRHGRVHGANLGVRGDAYRAVGGFGPVAMHEDADLVRRLVATGRPVAWPERPVVVSPPGSDPGRTTGWPRGRGTSSADDLRTLVG